MSTGSRYEILATVAVGDFATVYRARDRELGREVAVKQIHPQFLHDERQLARYWQEAQLLATLQHPNVLTIYDVVRSRGWLIVELMRGNLEQFAHGEPMDLDFLRMALGGCLSALEFLHRNGVIHGDVKPSNILIDRQGRVKLGDFGLARRASSESGSLLKGTTKYMAPELVSNQFGAVGPASDLYSLGFSAYEMICGASHFEDLFPGLGTFGRDKQIAWMMWHAAPDRQLPEIHRVLEGVPDDLARVVQKMVAKDQSRRYASARQALTELRVDPLAAPPAPPEEDAATMAAQAAAARKKKRKRLAAIAAVAFSLMICLAVFWPRPAPPPKGPPETIRGVITQVYPDELTVELRTKKEGEEQQVIKPFRLKNYDQILINDKVQSLRDVRPADQVLIEFLRDPSGRQIAQLKAYRPLVSRGKAKEIKADEALLTVAIEEGEDKGKDLEVSVAKDLPIALNGGKPESGGQTIALGDLQPDDRVTVAHLATEGGRNRKATSLTAERVVTLEGRVSLVDEKKRLLELAVGADPNPIVVKLPFKLDCEVTLNNQRLFEGQVLKPKDLRPNDKATVEHDSYAVRVSAYRVLGDAGVVQKLQFDSRLVDVLNESDGKTITYLVSPQCEITLGGENAPLTDLRKGDTVGVKHDTPGAPTPRAIRIEAVRPEDRNRWAVLVGNQTYEDAALPKIAHPVEDVRLMADALMKRYRLPVDQCITLTDESQVRLEQGIPERLGRVPAEARLVFYLAGHAYLVETVVEGKPERKVYFAPRSFDAKRPQETGLPLQWIVDELEKCPAKEKLLLLDCTQGGQATAPIQQPSAAEMIRALRPRENRALLRTVTAIVGSKAGQRGLVLPDSRRGLFASCLAQAYLGKADKDLDTVIEPTELFAYLGATMPSTGAAAGGSQEPELFLPDDSPPRLTEAAKKEIRALAAMLRQTKVLLDDLQQQYDAAKQLAGKEIEPKALLSLALLKREEQKAYVDAPLPKMPRNPNESGADYERREMEARREHARRLAQLTQEALRAFEELKNEGGDRLLPLQGVAWLRVCQRKYRPVVEDLKELMARLPKPAPGEAYSSDAQAALLWSGQLREFFGGLDDKMVQPAADALAALDAAVQAAGPEVERLYQEGRAATRAKLIRYDEQIAAANQRNDKAAAGQLDAERKQARNYAQFPYERAVERVLAGLDQ